MYKKWTIVTLTFDNTNWNVESKKKRRVKKLKSIGRKTIENAQTSLIVAYFITAAAAAAIVVVVVGKCLKSRWNQSILVFISAAAAAAANNEIERQCGAYTRQFTFFIYSLNLIDFAQIKKK